MNGDECSQVGWTKVTRARCRPAWGRRIAGRARYTGRALEPPFGPRDDVIVIYVMT